MPDTPIAMNKPRTTIRLYESLTGLKAISATSRETGDDLPILDDFGMQPLDSQGTGHQDGHHREPASAPPDQDYITYPS